MDKVCKQMNLHARSVDDDARILRIVGTTEALDRDGESIRVNGWKLDNFRKNPVVMFGHDYSTRPVARAVKIDNSGKALTFDVQFPTEEEAGEWFGFTDSVYRMLKSGFLNSSSVGFRPLKWEDADGDGKSAPRRIWTEQELMELSIVPVPSNPEALAAAWQKGAVKACDKPAIEMMLQHETAGIDGLRNLGWAQRIEEILRDVQDSNDGEAVVARADAPDPLIALRDEVIALHDSMQTVVDAVDAIHQKIEFLGQIVGHKLPELELLEARSIIERLCKVAESYEQEASAEPELSDDLDDYVMREIERMRARRKETE